MSARGYVTRDEIAEVAGLLCARPGQPSERAYIQATTINGEYENPIALVRLWVEVRELLEEARKNAERYGGTWEDHMPYRPDLFKAEDQNNGPIEDYDEAEDRRVALDIIRALAARFPLTTEERNSL